MTRKRKTPKVDKIYVAIAHHAHHMYTTFAWRWATMNVPHDRNNPQFKVQLVCPKPAFDLDLATTRNKMIQQAIDNHCDYVLFMDSDNPPTQDMLEQLYSHNKECVSGVYYIKQKNDDDVPMPVLYNRRKPRFDYGRQCLEPIQQWNQGDLITVDACGFGCMLVKIGLLKRIEEKYKEETHKWAMLPNAWVTEDIPFCDRVRDAGAKIYVDTNVQLEHLTVFGTGQVDFLRIKCLRMAAYGYKISSMPGTQEFRDEVTAFDFTKIPREELERRKEEREKDRIKKFIG